MANFATPFIVVNLGCEMIYVIDQRLKAQQIPADKSIKVLTDVTEVLLNNKLLDELFIPQPVGPHSVIKQLLQDISSASIMKLDQYSMNKLWDLMTMIFKWQISMSQNLFNITKCHLFGVAALLPEKYNSITFKKAMQKFEKIVCDFTEDDWKSLNNVLILWFAEYQTKISVLLRLGLQNKDGTFSTENNAIRDVLQNIGINIYLFDVKSVENQVGLISECTFSDTCEVSFLVTQLIGQPSSKIPNISLRLPLHLENPNDIQNVLTDVRKTECRNINITVNRVDSENELAFNPTVPNSAQEDLLQMIMGINITEDDEITNSMDIA